MNSTPIDQIYFPIKNNKPDYAYTLDTVQKHTFASGSPFLQGFIAQDYQKSDGTVGKRYLTISNFPAWL